METLLAHFEYPQYGKLEAGRAPGSSMQGWVRLNSPQEVADLVGYKLTLPGQRAHQSRRIEGARKEFYMSPAAIAAKAD